MGPRRSGNDLALYGIILLGVVSVAHMTYTGTTDLKDVVLAGVSALGGMIGLHKDGNPPASVPDKPQVE